MNRIHILIIAVFFGAALVLPSVSYGDKIIGIDLGTDVPPGVFCEINEVTLVAQSKEDCEKAGGNVTKATTDPVESENK